MVEDVLIGIHQERVLTCQGNRDSWRRKLLDKKERGIVEPALSGI